MTEGETVETDLASMIRGEHDEFREMLARLVSTERENADRKQEVFEALIVRSTSHKNAEEKAIMEPLLSATDGRAVALEMLEQHSAVTRIVKDMRPVPYDDELWLPKAKVLKMFYEGHFLSEEEGVLANLEGFFAASELGRIAEEFVSVRRSELEKRMSRFGAGTSGGVER